MTTREEIDAQAAAEEAAFSSASESENMMTYNDLIKRSGMGILSDNITYFKKISGGLFGKGKIEQEDLGSFVRSYKEGSNIILCFEKKSLKVPLTFITKEGGTTILFKYGLPSTTAPTSVGSKELEIGPPTNVSVSNETSRLKEDLSKQVKGKLSKLGGRKSRRKPTKKRSTRRRRH
jgi:hypothetical protein